MAVHAKTVEVDTRADLELWVRRGKPGDVTDGVESVLTSVDPVQAVDIVGVSGVRPMANEIRMDVTVDLVVQVTRENRRRAVEQALADGFGVIDVTSINLDNGD